jgi:hypothetical protein
MFLIVQENSNSSSWQAQRDLFALSVETNNVYVLPIKQQTNERCKQDALHDGTFTV